MYICTRPKQKHYWIISVAEFARDIYVYAFKRKKSAGTCKSKGYRREKEFQQKDKLKNLFRMSD